MNALWTAIGSKTSQMASTTHQCCIRTSFSKKSKHASHSSKTWHVTADVPRHESYDRQTAEAVYALTNLFPADVLEGYRESLRHTLRHRLSWCTFILKGAPLLACTCHHVIETSMQNHIKLCISRLQQCWIPWHERITHNHWISSLNLCRIPFCFQNGIHLVVDDRLKHARPVKNVAARIAFKGLVSCVSRFVQKRHITLAVEDRNCVTDKMCAATHWDKSQSANTHTGVYICI